jgi:hypothetical protein
MKTKNKKIKCMKTRKKKYKGGVETVSQSPLDQQLPLDQTPWQQQTLPPDQTPWQQQTLPPYQTPWQQQTLPPDQTPLQQQRLRGQTVIERQSELNDLESMSFPDFDSRSIYRRSLIIASGIVGSIAIYRSFSTIIQSLALEIPRLIAEDIYRSNPLGVTMTALTPIVRAIRSIGIYKDEEINDIMNQLITSIDRNTDYTFDITRQNGYAITGTTDIIKDGESLELGFTQTIFSLFNEILSIDPNSVITYQNFLHSKLDKETEEKSNTLNEEPPSSSFLIVDPEILQISSENYEEVRETFLEEYRNLIDGNTQDIQERIDIIDSEIEAREQARNRAFERLGERQQQEANLLEESQQASQARNRAFERLGERQQQEANLLEESQQASQSRIRVLERVNQRNIEGDYDNILAQLLIDQMYLDNIEGIPDSLPQSGTISDFSQQQNKKKSNSQPFSRAERAFLDNLRVRQPFSSNANSIGDLTAIAVFCAHGIRSCFRKSEKERNKEKEERIRKQQNEQNERLLDGKTTFIEEGTREIPMKEKVKSFKESKSPETVETSEKMPEFDVSEFSDLSLKQSRKSLENFLRTSPITNKGSDVESDKSQKLQPIEKVKLQSQPIEKVKLQSQPIEKVKLQSQPIEKVKLQSQPIEYKNTYIENLKAYYLLLKENYLLLKDNKEQLINNKKFIKFQELFKIIIKIDDIQFKKKMNEKIQSILKISKKSNSELVDSIEFIEKLYQEFIEKLYEQTKKTENSFEKSSFFESQQTISSQRTPTESKSITNIKMISNDKKISNL